jgi:hypothetical protein
MPDIEAVPPTGYAREQDQQRASGRGQVGRMPDYEIWGSAGEVLWLGGDQEEAFLAAMRLRRMHAGLEVIEIVVYQGRLRYRRIRRPDPQRAVESPPHIDPSCDAR